jgi:hypothetical protein
VRFQVEHRFAASPDAIAAVLADPAFYTGLDLPDLGRPQVLDVHARGDRTTVRLRYTFEGALDPAAVRLLGRDRLSWTQELEVDRTSWSGTFRFAAELDPRHLHGEGSFVLEPVPPPGTRRDVSLLRFDGELRVVVPGIGRLLERVLLPRLLELLEIEARAADDQLGVLVRRVPGTGPTASGREGADPAGSYTDGHERSR